MKKLRIMTLKKWRIKGEKVTKEVTKLRRLLQKVTEKTRKKTPPGMTRTAGRRSLRRFFWISPGAFLPPELLVDLRQEAAVLLG